MEIVREKTFIDEATIVPAGSDVAFSVTPDIGSLVMIERFEGAFTGGSKASVCCVWDYGTINEQVIDVANSNMKKLVGTGDGVKKVALVLSNNEDVQDLVFSASLTVIEEKVV